MIGYLFIFTYGKLWIDTKFQILNVWEEVMLMFSL